MPRGEFSLLQPQPAVEGSAEVPDSPAGGVPGPSSAAALAQPSPANAAADSDPMVAPASTFSSPDETPMASPSSSLRHPPRLPRVQSRTLTEDTVRAIPSPADPVLDIAKQLPPLRPAAPVAAGVVAEEEDVCRVCHGPGELNRELFFPCLCSGSIKYIHQDCLMMWLSHSMAKECEVCKHPFVFTPIYAPDAPARLPRSEILLGVLKTFGEQVKFALRVLLVFIAWTVVLPCITSIIWRMYFYRDTPNISPFSMSSMLMECIQGSAISAAIIVLYLAIGSLREYMLTMMEEEALARQLRNFGANENQQVLAAEPQAPPEQLEQQARDQLAEQVRQHALVEQEMLRDMQAAFGIVQAVKAEHLQLHSQLTQYADQKSTQEPPADLHRRHFLVKLQLSKGLELLHSVQQQQQQLLEDPNPEVRREHELLRERLRTGEAMVQEMIRTQSDKYEQVLLLHPGIFADIPEFEPLSPRSIAVFEAPQNLAGPADAPPMSPRSWSEISSLADLEEQPDVGAGEDNEGAVGDGPEQVPAPVPDDEPRFPAVNNGLENGDGGLFGVFNNNGNNANQDVDFEELVGLKGPISNLFETVGHVVLFNSVVLGLTVFLPFVHGRFVLLVFSSVAKNIGHESTEVSVDDLTTIIVGYFVAFLYLLIFAMVSQTLGAQFNQPTHAVTRAIAEILGHLGNFLKICLILGLELLVFPTFYGWFLDYGICESVPSSNFASRLSFAADSPVLADLLHWALGILFMVYISGIVSLCRPLLRPGVLWFLRNPQKFHPIKDIIRHSLARHFARHILTVCLYGILSIALVFLPLKTLSLFGTSLLPLRYPSLVNALMHEFLFDALFYHIVLPHMAKNLPVVAILRLLVKTYLDFVPAFPIFNLSSYLLVKPDDAAEDVPADAAAADADIDESDEEDQVEDPDLPDELEQEVAAAQPVVPQRRQRIVRPPLFGFRLLLFVVFSLACLSTLNLATVFLPVLCGRIIVDWINIKLFRKNEDFFCLFYWRVRAFALCSGADQLQTMGFRSNKFE
eukprot:TRINITY_DN5542_c0_g1_i1.p1 TRINITY_DN5542_c0_g1~~TRINITY_DN5542_c0_g1_i1.p1  ORF type:complete len:1136 (+),score=265.84 TRINITY_DN5542_c0_g1_i1:327-3410(+)